MTYPQEKIFDTGPCIWDIMVTINRKDTYDNTTRRETTGPRCWNAGRLLGASLQRGRCEARPATGEKPKAAAHGSEARRKDQRPGNPGGRASRIYPGIQARAGEAAGRQRAPEGPHRRAGPPPLQRRNHLRRRLINRGLRAPIINHQSEGASNKRSRSQAGRVGPQARKPSVASSRTLDPGSR